MIDYFERHPWKLANFLDKCAGFWPYYSWLRKSSIMSYHLLVIISLILPLAYNLKKNVGVDFEIVLKCALTILLVFGDLSKTLVFFVCQGPRRRTYDRIFDHYEEIEDEEEAAVLRDFTKRGLRYALVYIFACYMILGLFSAIPLARTYHNYYFGDGQFVVNLPLEVDYGVDKNEYVLPIMLHFTVTLLSSSIVSFSFDMAFIYVLKVYHACALVKIVTMRLERTERIVCESASNVCKRLTTDEIHALVRGAIKLHGESFELISLIEDVHGICFFFLLLINTATFGALIHLISTTISDPLESSRHILGFLLLLIHFYVMFSQGQAIIDSTSGIFDACYNCKWYELPKNMHTMWMILMIRSSKPCEITGGKCFILSIETYGKMLKAGISYYTLFEK